MKLALFLFHRDLRLFDNTSLNYAIKEGYIIIPVFIFPPEQIDPLKNKYFSHPAVQFMCESIEDLSNKLNKISSELLLFKGDNIKILEEIYKSLNFEALFTNMDYSKYAYERDSKIEKWCNNNSVNYKSYEDYGLFSLQEGLMNDVSPYLVLSAYYKKYLKELNVRDVQKNVAISKNFYKGVINIKDQITLSNIKKFYNENINIKEHGGRENSLNIIKNVATFKNYKHDRDYPAKDSTTHLSAHLKFGTISIRELYWELNKEFGKDNPLIRELVFRDFYMKIFALNPELQRGVALHSKLDENIPWNSVKKNYKSGDIKTKKYWKAWISGNTGFPLVDAGMRQLMKENWVHNRIRMLVACVATKYLLLDWRDCSQFYYKNLVDCDIFSNTAGWTWAASVGPDPLLYFRAPFNPYIQSKKFDIDAVYIKKFIPELEGVDSNDIHKWGDEKIRNKYPNIKYPAPIVDQKEASQNSIKIWKHAYVKNNI